jgi:predicted phage terminase large subunit-like protein
MRDTLERRTARVTRRLSAPPKTADPVPFGMDWLSRFLPHYLTNAASRMHTETVGTLAGLSETRGQQVNRMAPRGFAKSTLVSKAYPLWSALEGREPFTLLLSDTSNQAITFLKAIKREVETNDAIRSHYGRISRPGAEWKSDLITLPNGCMIAAVGAQGRIRGLTNNNRRPTLVCIDDANKREDAYSPTMRARTMDWLLRDVMPVGEPGHTNFLCVGTPIHREAVVCSLAVDKTWETRSYRAIERMPDRMDLWLEWENVLSNLGDDDRAAQAAAFYGANRGEMDRGACLLWPERFPLVWLMERRAALGASAFDSEYGDTPGTAGSTEWPPEYFDRPDIWFTDWPDDLVGKAYYLDPSKGEGSKSSDWQAHCWGGWSKSLNALVVECDCRREPVTQMVERAIANAQRFGCPVTAETNGTMGLLMAEFTRQANGRVVGLQGINNSDAKLQRIRTLGPFLARGQVKIRNTAGGRELVSQLRDVPNGEYDDAPDAASGALRRVLVNLNGGG